MDYAICGFCGNPQTELYSMPIDYISGERFSVVRCMHCGLIFVAPFPSLEKLDRYYPIGHQRAAPASYEKMDARERVRYIERFVDCATGKVLDIGCGKGLLLLELRARGWTVFGTELSEISSSFARKNSLAVHTSAVEDVCFEPKSFDLITLFHVLEHLPDPKNTLSTAFSLLRPGGLLLVEVPNIGSWYARLFGDNWFHYDVPRHLFHFTSATLSRHVSGAGFQIVRTETRNTQYDAFGAIQSFLNCILPTPNLLNNFNTKQITLKTLWRGENRISSLFSLIFSELLFVIGFPLMALVAILLSPCAEGGTLRILAKKPV